MLDLTMARDVDFRRECERRRAAGLVAFCGAKLRTELQAIAATWDATIGAWLLPREEFAAALGLRERRGKRGRKFYVAPEREEADLEITLETHAPPAWRCKKFGCGESSQHSGLCSMHYYEEGGP